VSRDLDPMNNSDHLMFGSAARHRSQSVRIRRPAYQIDATTKVECPEGRGRTEPIDVAALLGMECGRDILAGVAIEIHVMSVFGELGQLAVACRYPAILAATGKSPAIHAVGHVDECEVARAVEGDAGKLFESPGRLLVAQDKIPSEHVADAAQPRFRRRRVCEAVASDLDFLGGQEANLLFGQGKILLELVDRFEILTPI
jgi:hypothetical protein